jgi:hypothetical protein
MTQETANKRFQQRNRCLKEGKIIFGNGTFVVDCTIDNVSETGAHVRVLGSSPLPKEFLLVEPSRNIVHKAEIVRRTPKGSASGSTVSSRTSRRQRRICASSGARQHSHAGSPCVA